MAAPCGEPLSGSIGIDCVGSKYQNGSTNERKRGDMSSNPPKQFSYGGQAVIEGVMMRGVHKAAIAARDPNGEIHIKEIDLNPTLYRGRISRTPFIRGLIGLWDALGLGTRALLWSADVALIEGSYYRIQHNGSVAWIQHDPTAMKAQGNLEDVPTLKADLRAGLEGNATIELHLNGDQTIQIVAEPNMDAKVIEKVRGGSYTVTGFKPSEKQEDIFTGAAATLMVIVSLAVGIGLFFILPTMVSSGANSLFNLNSTTATNLVEEAVKLTLFLGYLTLIGQMNDVKRLFRYHGAEHKTINAYEAGAELTPKVVQEYPIEHPRCGTAFLLNVIIISIIVNNLIGRFDNNLFILVPVRILTIPVVAGIAYEWLRLTAKYINNPMVRLLVKPNLALQSLTTREPDDDMVEVAIRALERVLVSEGIAAQEVAPESAGQALPAEA
jgi:uncharacterized protein YqhQ